MSKWNILPRGLRDAINRYAAAHILDSWKGNQLPEDWPAIEQELKAAREALATKLIKIIEL